MTRADQVGRRDVAIRLRELTEGGFDPGRQAVILNGRAENRQVAVMVERGAIADAFPAVASTSQCVAFVGRNIGAFKDIANVKLRDGGFVAFPTNRDWPFADLLVEVTVSDVERSRRWLRP